MGLPPPRETKSEKIEPVIAEQVPTLKIDETTTTISEIVFARDTSIIDCTTRTVDLNTAF